MLEPPGCCHRRQSWRRQTRRREKFILFCWKRPQRICIRGIVVMPTASSFGLGLKMRPAGGAACVQGAATPSR